MQIKAVIFDMDGVLVDSEPYWRKAMVKVFSSAGIPFSEADCRLTTGKRINEVVHIWNEKRPFPYKSPVQVQNEIVEELCWLLKENPIEMPGVQEVMNTCSRFGLLTGLATSSSTKIINTILEKLKLDSAFRSIHSAENLHYGKPHPQVFLNCAAQLEISPENCCVIEDSVNGVIAAKAAGMFTVAIPESIHYSDPRFSIADIRLKNLLEFDTYLVKFSREVSTSSN